jgi:hypothetical protein
MGAEWKLGLTYNPDAAFDNASGNFVVAKQLPSPTARREGGTGDFVNKKRSRQRKIPFRSGRKGIFVVKPSAA